MRWKLVVGGLGLVAVVGALVGFWRPFERGPKTLRLPGLVEIQEVRLSPKIGGRVTRVVVKEGQLVQAKDPVLYLEVPDLEAQREQWRARLEAAEAELEKARVGPREEEKDAARAAVAAAKARWERLEAGPRDEEIEQARHDVASAEADWKHARAELQRMNAMPRGASETDRDAARAAVGRMQGRTEAARARLKLLLAGSHPKEIAEAAAELQRAQANFDLLQAGTRSEDKVAAQARVDEMRARLKEIDANLKEAVVVAPEPAVVEVLAVRPGDVVAPNTPVARVLRAEDLWVKVYVPETELGKVRLNQAVEVAVDSYPDKRFEGTVTQIAAVSEFTPRNVQSADERRHQVFAVKVRVADPQGVFKSGMAAEVWLPLSTEY